MADLTAWLCKASYRAQSAVIFARSWGLDSFCHVPLPHTARSRSRHCWLVRAQSNGRTLHSCSESPTQVRGWTRQAPTLSSLSSSIILLPEHFRQAKTSHRSVFHSLAFIRSSFTLGFWCNRSISCFRISRDIPPTSHHQGILYLSTLHFRAFSADPAIVR